MVAARFLPDMGGIETHLDQVSRRLVARGHEVSVLATDRTGAYPKEETRHGVSVARVRAHPKRRDYYIAPEILSKVWRSDADLIHIQGCHTFVPIFAMLSAIRRKKPFVVTFHSGGHSSRLRSAIRAAQWKLLAPLFRKARHLIGVSRFEKDYFAQTLSIPRDRWTVIPNGAEMPVNLNVRPDPDTVQIVSIGRLERYKGHHRVIQAFPYVVQAFPNARLRILGEGPYKATLLKLADQLGVAARVEIGGVPPSDREGLVRILGTARLAVLFSEYEAHPIAVMEALSLGCPVLVAQTSGFIELVEDGLVRGEPLDSTSEDLGKSIISEIRSPQRPDGLKLPTWDSCVDEIEKVYRRSLR
jgi:glycosyltransferase involved in cell wall biosynthesis